MSTSNGTKKSGSVLGLLPLDLQSASLLGLPPICPPDLPPTRAISRREGRIVGAFHEDVLIMEATTAKAEYGMSKLGEVQLCASRLWGSTLSVLFSNSIAFKGTELEPYIAEFTMRQVQMHAGHLMKALEITGMRIGEQIHSSLDLPPDKPSLLERIFGRRD